MTGRYQRGRCQFWIKTLDQIASIGAKAAPRPYHLPAEFSPPAKESHPLRRSFRIAAHVPRWGAQLTSNWSESRAWETYRMLQRQYASLIGDREPIVLHGRLPGMGSVSRTIIRIGDDNRAPLDTLCNKLIAAGGACVVLRNQIGGARINADAQSPGDAPPPSK
jgi:hypothetical protein